MNMDFISIKYQINNFYNMCSFGEKSLFLLCPVGMFIFSCIRMYIELDLLFPLKNRPNQELYIIYPLIKSFFIIISNFLFGIPTFLLWLLEKRNQKRNKLFEKEKTFSSTFLAKTQIKAIPNQRFQQLNSFAIYLYIFGIAVLVSFFLPIVNFLHLLHSQASQIGYSMNILLIIINAYFTYKLFHYSLYRHQITAICLCFIGIILVQIPGYINQDNTTNLLAVYLGFFGLQFVISCLDLSYKWLMEQKFIPPCSLLFYLGTFSLLIYFIGFIILSNVTCPDSWKATYCDKDDGIINVANFLYCMTLTDYGWAVLLTMNGSLYLISYFMTNFHYTPTHRCISDIFSSFVFWIPTFTPQDGFISLAGYLISLFGALVFNEIILINCWKFNKNTRKILNERSNFEIVNQTVEFIVD